MTRTPRPRAVAALTAVSALLLSGLLAGCSDSKEPAADPSTSPSTPEASASADLPDGVELTEPGSQLAFGDAATVAYELRQQAGYLDLTVRSATRGSLKDFVGFDMTNPLQKKANYFYVRVTVKNVGEDQFGGIEVPLLGISGTNTLLPPVKFTSAFKKCPTEVVPKGFAPGDTFNTCLVFLSPDKGSLEGVSYRPLDSFDPIDWRGQVQEPVIKKKKPAKKKAGAN